MDRSIPQKHENQLTPVFITDPREGAVPQDSRMLITCTVRVKGKICSARHNGVYFTENENNSPSIVDHNIYNIKKKSQVTQMKANILICTCSHSHLF